MNKGEYSSVLDTTVKEQMKILQNKKLDDNYDAINSICLTDMMFMLAYLTDEVSSVADELRALREEIANRKE
jgi:hypothetical protein